MDYDLIYRDEKMELCEDFIDVGYMAENIEVTTLEGKALEVKRSHQDSSMTILASFPNCEDFEREILALDTFLSHLQVIVHSYLIFDTKSDTLESLAKKLKTFKALIDSEREFGPMYGTEIASGSLEGKLTKSLFLISKDGAIFYLDMPKDLEKSIDLDRLQIELNKAYITYTGVGCHD